MSIIEHAKVELAAINFGEEDSRIMIEILEKFFDQWDSGGAVSCAAPVLQRLIAGKPLSPITGEDSEWFVHDCDGMYAQNKRCSTIFKSTKDGPAYDIDVSHGISRRCPELKCRKIDRIGDWDINNPGPIR